MPRVVFHTDMAERVCEEGTQVTQEPAGPDYTTWGQVWDDMRDEEWYADSFRPGGRCHFPRVPDQVLDEDESCKDHFFPWGHIPEAEVWPELDADRIARLKAKFLAIVKRNHQEMLDSRSTRKDPEALLGTMAPMNNWHHMVGHYSNCVRDYKRYRTSRVRGRKATVRSQHRTIRRVANLALAQVA